MNKVHPHTMLAHQTNAKIMKILVLLSKLLYNDDDTTSTIFRTLTHIA